MRHLVLVCFAACLSIGFGSARAQNCASIRTNICSLATFNPNPQTGGGTNSPQCDASNPPSQAQLDAIEAAYDLAPSNVQADLCKITKFFIDQTFSTPSASWGRWESPLYHTAIPGSTQIVINVADIGQNLYTILNRRLHGLGVNSAYGQHSQLQGNGSTRESSLSLLYVIAHELGHIRWHKFNFIGEYPGCSDDDPNSTFYSWAPLSTAQLTNRWTYFGQENLEMHAAAVEKPSGVHSANDLNGIYGGGFVTALAAANPEEDFVESYTMNVVRQVCPGCKFGIWIPASGSGSAYTALHNDRGHSELRKKFSCVSDKHINQSRH